MNIIVKIVHIYKTYLNDFLELALCGFKPKYKSVPMQKVPNFIIWDFL